MLSKSKEEDQCNEGYFILLIKKPIFSRVISYLGLKVNLKVGESDKIAGRALALQLV